MENNIKYCQKCGAENSIDAIFCSTCGTKFDGDQNKKKRRPIVIIVIIAVVILLSVLITKSIRENNYYYRCVNATQIMIQGAIEAESACNEIVQVWNNSIYKIKDTETSIIKTDKYTLDENGKFYDDFNVALAEYTNSGEYADHVGIIVNNQNDVAPLMQNIKYGYSGKYKDIGNKVLELYDEYIKITNMAIYINGSLISYNAEFVSIDKEFLDLWTNVSGYLK